MSETPNIIKPLDKEKALDTIDLYPEDRRKTETQLFIKQLEKVQQEHFSAERPYDYRAAKFDFEKEQAEIFNRNPKKYKNDVRNVPVEDFDFKKYGDPKRFDLEKEDPVIEYKLIDGIKQEVQTGIYKSYRSNKFRNKVAVFCKSKSSK